MQIKLSISTSPSTDPITPGAWQGSHWSANFKSLVWLDPGKILRKRDSNPGSSPPEADALTTRPTRRSIIEVFIAKHSIALINSPVTWCIWVGLWWWQTYPRSVCSWCLQSRQRTCRWCWTWSDWGQRQRWSIVKLYWSSPEVNKTLMHFHDEYSTTTSTTSIASVTVPIDPASTGYNDNNKDIIIK